MTDQEQTIDIIEEEFLNLEYYKRKQKECKEYEIHDGRDYRRLKKKCKERLKNWEKSFPDEYIIAKLRHNL